MPLHCAAIRAKFFNFQCLPFFDDILENQNSNYKMLPSSSILVLTSSTLVTCVLHSTQCRVGSAASFKLPGVETE